jgi:uncharacterized protein
MQITTPCIKLCVLDERFGLCLGCGRTLSEIGAWSAMSEAERGALMPALPERLAALGTRTGRRRALTGRAGGAAS